MMLLHVLSFLIFLSGKNILGTKLTGYEHESVRVVKESEYDPNFFEITYPERTDGKRRKRDLRTQESQEGEPDEDASYLIRAFGKGFPLKVNIKRDHFASDFKLRYFDDGKEIFKTYRPRSCHYHGEVEGIKDSSVAMSTCDRGLRAVVRAGKHSFYLEPNNDMSDGSHKVFPMSEHEGDDDRRTKRTTYKDPQMPLKEYYQQFLTTNETRYNELYIVVDSYLYKNFGFDKNHTIDRVLHLVNTVDELYKMINIRVVLVGVEIWSDGDKIKRSHEAKTEYFRFGYYKARVLNRLIHHDNAHFFSAIGWSGIGGMAGLGSICSSTSHAIVSWSRRTQYVGPVVAFSHEMGHNFRMAHDSSRNRPCYCPTKEGCNMGGKKFRYPLFSVCSMWDLAKLQDHCLYNVPSTSFSAKCGNGIKEEEEECDCGTAEECISKDPCCEPLTCKLKASSQCSDMHHSCCNKCLFKRGGSVCREAATQCDVPEYCTGTSGDCPADNVKQDGQICDNRVSTLSLSSKSGWTNVELKPRLITQYIKFTAIRVRGKPFCTKVSFRRCLEGWDDPMKSTGLNTDNNLCVKPKTGGCSPAEGTKLVYAENPGGYCGDDDMQFFYDKKTKVLKHACSGMYVCPLYGSNLGTPIVLSSTCSESNAKWTRTNANALQHAATTLTRCISPIKLPATAGQEMRLHYFCNKREFNMPQKDCNVQAKIRDIICTTQNTVILDLKEKMTLGKIKLNGPANWRAGKAEYLVHSSDNGKNWTPYVHESDESSSSSHCYEGRCAESREVQCKELWGTSASDGLRKCYDKLNTCGNCYGKIYGTCDPTQQKPCAAEDAVCGQLQCSSSLYKPIIDYADSYKKLDVEGEVCSAASLNSTSDQVGLGMVSDGTKCGDNKMCKDNKCKSFDDLGINSCPFADGKECAGRGVCTYKGTCSCESGYDPDTNCSTALVPVDGSWGDWSDWSVCNKSCEGGKKFRYRFCNNPAPLNGGKFCRGKKFQSKSCNKGKCPGNTIN